MGYLRKLLKSRTVQGNMVMLGTIIAALSSPAIAVYLPPQLLVLLPIINIGYRIITRLPIDER